MSETTTIQKHTKLGEFASTAIAGNDILSSCLYVCGITALFAGIWSPIIFIIIAFVLYLYKHVYTEVVEALPLNGGAYNCLLNATVKNFAALAGVMTVLSYMATTVISAKTAVEYLHSVVTQLPVLPTTVIIIAAFAVLTIAGVKDSAKVAMAIFAFHIFTLLLFVSVGLLTMFNTGIGNLGENLTHTTNLFAHSGSWKMLFFAFSASLLGVSGFESSANFVEEQQPGVFRKTLRNMILGVLVFNPLISLVVLHSLPLEHIWASKDFVLAESAVVIGGQGLKYLVVIDAFLVLSGAVLASFVGATGLLYRMTLDHCLPTIVFLPKLRQRNQNVTRVVIAFAILCLSVMFITKGNLLSLAGVYTISFLGVMTFFAVGNLILKKNRPDLKRTYRSPIFYVVLAATATAAGIVGNILIDNKNLYYFLVYFIPGFYLVLAMIYRDYILDFFVSNTKKIPWLHKLVQPLLDHVVRPRIILFAHHPEKLFSSLQYISRNETSRHITVVFCAKDAQQPHQKELKFQEYLRIFKEAGVFPLLELNFEVDTENSFGPEIVKIFAVRFKITRNNIFIGSIHHSHAFSFEDLGGVRVIQ
ncbi:APC family permease [Candidatus Woesebacteria bacterium]|nr:APC family permease [Candidatus Woesebacteria bacterium]